MREIRICARYGLDTPAIQKKNEQSNDSEIRTGSCSDDQMVIRIQNHVISCECLLLFHFLNYHCQFIYIHVISFDRLIFLTSLITVPLHMTLVTAHLLYLVDMSTY